MGLEVVREGTVGVMSSLLRRLTIALAVLWILVATNPEASSFRRYISSRRSVSEFGNFRTAVPALAQLLKRILATSPPPRDSQTIFEGLDCILFTLVRSRTDVSSQSMSIIYPPPPSHIYLGILNMWLPVPNPGLWIDGDGLRSIVFTIRDVLRSTARPSTPRSLPARPWEWLVASFAVAGAFWFVLPEAAARHLTLTWENARHAGRWWTLVLFHVSHGGSILRLTRTIAACNYLAPKLIKHKVLTLSGLYGVILTACAMSTALGMLVLARRNVFRAGNVRLSSALEINGGGGCVYALLVAACLDAQSGRLGAGKVWRVRPFELLMLNIAFDAMFLAGQKRIADYTAHTGAALGAWLYCSLNQQE